MNAFSNIEIMSVAGFIFAIWFFVFLWRFMSFLQERHNRTVALIADSQASLRQQIEDLHEMCYLCKLETQEIKEKLSVIEKK